MPTNYVNENGLATEWIAFVKRKGSHKNREHFILRTVYLYVVYVAERGHVGAPVSQKPELYSSSHVFLSFI